MYNQYLDDSDFILLDQEPQSPQSAQNRQGQGQDRGPGQEQRHASPNHRRPAPTRPQEPPRSKNDLLGEVTGGLSQLLDGVLKHFSLKNFDTGDILLVLIILFLYLEGDNLELVITLGLLLLLGLDGDEPKNEEESL